jgi:ABC-type multidrug transport system ATPase subunit
MLKVTDVSKVLGTRYVLEHLALEVKRGEIAVVLGENGSGKSTLLRVVCGILQADQGDVVIDGVSMKQDDVRAKAKVGYVPDATEALPELLVREFIDLVWALKAPALGRVEPPSETSIARLGLRPIWGRSIGALSFGQRKRMCLLAATCGDPPLLVLDEPSNGLDPEGTDLAVALIGEHSARDGATLLTTNDEAFAARLTGARYWLSRGLLTPA